MRIALAAGVCVMLCAGWATAQCTVRSVHDGDTMTAVCPEGVLRVRLVEIDAPERAQPYSRRATNSLKALCVGKQVALHQRRLDRYGRTLARAYCDGVDVSAEQVRRGYAWAFDQYLTDAAIKRLEDEARQARRGLWAGAAPVPPWEFRQSAAQ